MYYRNASAAVVVYGELTVLVTLLKPSADSRFHIDITNAVRSVPSYTEEYN